MDATASWKSRLRRLAFAVLLWALALALTGVLIRIAAARQRSVPASPESSVGFRQGRLPFVRWTTTRTGVDPRLSHVANVIAGLGVDVYCWSDADWSERAKTWERRWPQFGTLGRPWRAYTFGTPQAMHLSPAICEQLTKLEREPKPVWDDASPDALAWSVGAVAHESQYIAGISNQAKAECYGVQAIRETAVLLGRTSAEGQYLAVVFWKRWHPWMPREYQSPECVDGGRLDLHPGTAVWP